MQSRIKIGILIFLVFLGLLINYDKKDLTSNKLFPTIENPCFAFIPLYKKIASENNNQNPFFGQNNFWGWPFTYWQNNKLIFKSLVYDLIFYIAIWLIIISILWFIVGVKKLEEKRFKPPKFKF